MSHYFNQSQITSADLELFAAFYYYGYTGMQLTTAVLLEKYPINRVIGGFVCLCGLAMYTLNQAHHFYVALLCLVLGNFYLLMVGAL